MYVFIPVMHGPFILIIILDTNTIIVVDCEFNEKLFGPNLFAVTMIVKRGVGMLLFLLQN